MLAPEQPGVGKPIRVSRSECYKQLDSDGGDCGGPSQRSRGAAVGLVEIRDTSMNPTSMDPRTAVVIYRQLLVMLFF